MWSEQQVTTFVEGLLTMQQPDGYGYEWLQSPAGQCALHLAMALVNYAQLADDEQQAVSDVTQAIATYIRVRIKVKTMKKRTKREKTKKKKKEIPPTPPIVEKEKEKEKETKTRLRTSCACESSEGEEERGDISAGCTVELDRRREQFHQQCLQLCHRYDNERLTDFFNYWSEEDATGRMRWERQRFWNLEKRVARWMKNQYASDCTAAALRLSKARQRQQGDAQRQQADADAAARREAQRLERERQREADRRGAETTAEYLRRNPDSLLARMAREREAREAQGKVEK